MWFSSVLPLTSPQQEGHGQRNQNYRQNAVPMAQYQFHKNPPNQERFHVFDVLTP
jgi:hypothetical protein